MQIHFMKSKLCISPIISVILILVVTTISVTSFLSWYSSYESNLNTKIESTIKQSNPLTIETIAGSVLYVKSNENTTIKSIKLDNNICSLDLNLTAGINEIDISTCINNLTRSNPSVSLVSDNQVLSKNIYIKELNKYPTIQHGCTLDGISLEHGENYSFYQNIFSFNCSNEVSVLFCDNGVLEHSDTYKYHSCNTYNSCSIGGQTLEHNTSQIFYFKSFDEDGCINETRTCNNGVLNGSYTYTNCVENIATGGDYVRDLTINDITYRIHLFTTPQEQDFTVLQNNLDIEYLVVGGGGGGGDWGGWGGVNSGGGGGGGAGGFLEGNTTLSLGTVKVKVGLGGTTYGMLQSPPIPSGENSYIGEHIIAYGGGNGGNAYNGPYGYGLPGGSGGGAGHQSSSPGSGTSGQGNSGSNGNGGTSGGGAGGGAGSAGTGPGPLGRGGEGKISNIINKDIAIELSIGEVINNDVWFAGGGGPGGGYYGAQNQWGYGGSGGGGRGGTGGYAHNTEPGKSNTGGGGGGGGYGNSPREIDGGSGVVIIRYAIN